MKVLFAVHDEKVSLSIVKKYQREYKEIISYKNVYYYNAIIKELQRDKTYDRIIIDEELEEFTSTSYEEKDKFIFNKLDNITDEASNSSGKDIPIILICSERRAKGEEVLVKLFGIGIYNAIIGNDRSTDEVCRLINSPRSKKEAKTYYKISSKDVEYDPKDENDVSEEEMQHILSYFKKIGKNKEKYDDCFKKIASQYNDKQMKIIIAILPANVKEVLQEISPTYQKYVPNTASKRNSSSRGKRIEKEEQPTSEVLLSSNKNRNKKQIVVPSTIEKNLVKKITIKSPLATKSIKPAYDQNDDNDDDDEDFEDLNTSASVVETEKSDIEEKIEESTTKKRGRPSKKAKYQDEEAKDEPTQMEIDDEEMLQNEQADEEDDADEDFDAVLPGLNDDEDAENNEVSDFGSKYEPIDESLLRPEPISDDILPGVDDMEGEEEGEEEDDEEDDENDGTPDLKESDDDEEQDETPDFKESDDDEEQEDDQNWNQYSNENEEKPENDYDFNQNDDDEEDNQEDNYNYIENFKGESYNKYEISNSHTQNMEIQRYEPTYNDYDYTNYNNLLSSDRKVIAFVGTSKNGTSFIVNNIAKILSENGINTAILDATQSKNSYYIYNNNDDGLRNAAASSLENITQGIAGGMKVSKNLSVYVEIPGQSSTKINDVGPILENLAKNHVATLIDCDFSTPIEYFANVQELFLVQSMDVLTIQPLTAFLKELKNRDVLEQHKIRIIINKALRLRGITSKQIVGGMSRYNNPEMSMMTELFDRNLIVPIEVPFDTDVYARYLEGIADCSIAVNKYPKDFQNILNKLSNVIYPLLPAKKNKEKTKKGYEYPGNGNYTNGFSNNVNNTLNNMRKKY